MSDRRQPRLVCAPAVFELLAGLASRRERIAYADFAWTLGLGSPRNLGWLLTPFLAWCREGDLPWLPIIVVRRADGLPSGGYPLDRIATETERVFGHPWSDVTPPAAANLAAHAVPRSPRPRRATSPLGRAAQFGALPC